jgi:hypothetical protein
VLALRIARFRKALLNSFVPLFPPKRMPPGAVVRMNITSRVSQDGIILLL